MELTTRSGRKRIISTPNERNAKAKKSPASARNTRNELASKQNITLVGKTSNNITGSKLPSNRQILQMLFYNIRFVRMSLRESAYLVLKAVAIFWAQARIPTRADGHCVDKIVALYDKWRLLNKTVENKRYDRQQDAVEEFVNSLDDLFDIASVDALEKVKLDEDRKFLMQQRQRGRPGCMIGVDRVLAGREARAMEREAKQQARKRKHAEMLQVDSILEGTYHCISLNDFVLYHPVF